MAAVTCALVILPLLIFSMPGCCFAAANATKSEAAIRAKPTYQSNKQGGRVLFPSSDLRYQLYLVAPTPAPQDAICPPTPAGAASQGRPGNEGKPSSDRRLLPGIITVRANVTKAANITLTAKPTYQSNINALLNSLSQAANQSAPPTFYHASVANDTSSAVYGLYLCRGDVTDTACRDCVSAAASALPGKCTRGKQAVVWYDQCIIRYSDKSFLGRLDTSNNYTSALNSTVEVNSVLLNQVLSATANKAANGSTLVKFATEQTEFDGSHTVNVEAQCTPDLTEGDCNQCLSKCIGLLPECCANKQGGRVLFPSCNLRYQLYLVAPTPDGIRPPTPAGAANKGRPGNEGKPSSDRRHLPGIISGSVLGVLMLFLTITLWFYLQEKKAKRASEDVRDIVTAESLQMEFNTIRAATQNFAADRKLGQGGFGEVYKGTLENGHDIAVKRLSRDSGQGTLEFKTEVLLVAKLQHRNLVKLLGFCVCGKEKILVYEYLPNSSLDKTLFDSTKRAALAWETRFKIIYGIARGLLYLHEDSRLKIVHRDLKTSNILLDEAMNPKIADFGLAKLFGVDQTQDATNTIVGTYGYMAPEYILTGHYSVKSDVYTFGIIVLEVVSGQRNKYLNRSHLEEALLHRAWRLWTEDETLKLVDETLGNNYSVDDVIKCIHIGLLCIQENATRRPSMISVVAALGGQSIKLPSPTPPNFLAPAAPVSGMNSTTSGSNPGQGASVYTTSDISTLDPR